MIFVKNHKFWPFKQSFFSEHLAILELGLVHMEISLLLVIYNPLFRSLLLGFSIFFCFKNGKTIRKSIGKDFKQ
jgi:hypothetical protein